MTPRFPADWPSCCPPDNAEPARRTVFRLVSARPPTAEDLRSHHERGSYPTADPCLRCGLSVLPERSVALHQRRLFPWMGSFLAQGALQPEHGKLKDTPSRKQPRHMTFWPYQDVDRAALFCDVEEIS